MGVALKSNVAVPNPTGAFKKLRKDAILTNGSLLLIDLMHSYAPLVGTPASGDLIENIAWEEAAALHGSGARADWKLTYGFGGTFSGSGSDGFIERSTKGGLHVCMSQSTSGATGRQVSMGLASSHKLKDYLYANWEHEYYLDRFERVTRTALDAACPEYVFASGNGGNTSNYLQYANRDANFAANKLDYSYAALPIAAAGPQHRAVRNLGRTGNAPSSANGIALYAGLGQMGAFNSLHQNKARSAVIYGYYLEDLTVSGRTFEEVRALRAAIFNKEVLTAGGKYYGDTFTAVATCP